MHSEPTLRYVTASLRVDYLKPTPLGVWLEVRGKVRKIRGRTVEIEEWITATDEVTVRGELVAVRMPAKLILQLSDEKAPE
jgi:acyl-CoA thioesterase FadM